MANLVFDFLHNYHTGERRESDPADAYQYDEGHVMEAVVPVEVTSCEIHYWVRGQEEAEAYVPESITQNEDGSYSIIGHIPNTYFETYGELRVYIVVTDGTASITTYEGRIHICERSKPDDYVDDDPDNEAVQIIAAARGYAETSEAWAVGQINGEDVPSTADQYQNNASYYADQAASAASSAAAQASLAPVYDNTATYEVGDYCLYSGQLYECTTAITTAEAWDSTHWTAVTVGGELATLKDGLEDVETKLTATSENVLNKAALTIGKFVNKSGSTGSSASYAHTDYIKVKEGDVVKGYAGEQTSLGFRFVCAYNSERVAISSSGAENVESYTVPSGISFLRLTGYVRTDDTGINGDTARIFLNGVDGKYQEYKTGDVSGFCSDIYATEQILANYPLTTITPYMVNLLSYRPLGVLTKGYICLVSDDGDAELATYTIPMLQNKGDIPCTFAVMKSSTVFSTDSGLAAVVDAVNNHGCNIAQHGGTTWDQYDELWLNNFFDSEKSYWDSIGLVPYGAVCPAHNINNLIRAICGGRFGCLRTGYQNGVPYYPDYTNGARSNIFGLTSQSSVDSSLADQKEILDNVKANHLLRMIHWHENELTTEKKEQLEGIIDYALEIGLTFITMKEIPNII